MIWERRGYKIPRLLAEYDLIQRPQVIEVLSHLVVINSDLAIMQLTGILRFATVLVATTIPTISVAQDPESILARQNELGTSINGVETCLRNYDGGFRTSMSCVLAFCKMYTSLRTVRNAFEASPPMTAAEVIPIVRTYGEVNQDAIAALGEVPTKVCTYVISYENPIINTRQIPVLTRAGLLTFGTVVVRGLDAEREAIGVAARAKIPSEFHQEIFPLVDPLTAAFDTALAALGGSTGPLNPILPGN